VNRYEKKLAVNVSQCKNGSGEFMWPLSSLTKTQHKLQLNYYLSHFLDTTFDFTSFFALAFWGRTLFHSLAVVLNKLTFTTNEFVVASQKETKRQTENKLFILKYIATPFSSLLQLKKKKKENWCITYSL